MKFIISVLSVMVLVNTSFAQSAPEYVELICSSKEKLASIYSSDPIEDVMAMKVRELTFWTNRIDDALKTAKLLNEGGPALVQSKENIDTTMAALKACTAYLAIEPVVMTYLKSNVCVDDQGNDYDITEAGFACRLLMPK